MKDRTVNNARNAMPRTPNASHRRSGTVMMDRRRFLGAGLAFLLFVALSTQAVAQGTSISPKGEIATNTDNYTGTIWLNHLSEADSTFHFNITLATYAPTSKLDWHIHPGGQILLITEGTGYYQEKGKPGRIVHKGDVIKCPPGVAHTHSAAPNSSFAYIGIESSRIKWLQRVTDEEYHSIDPPSYQ